MDSLLTVIEKRYEQDVSIHDTEELSEADESDDEFLPKVRRVSASDRAALELNTFLKCYKNLKVQPKYKRTNDTMYLHGTESDFISDSTIVIGNEIEEKGEDLPSGRNLANYFDKEGQFQHVKFWNDHKSYLPKLRSYAVERASFNTTEVPCETLFSQSGYASEARRTRLKSKQFEREVTLAYNLKHVFFDIERAMDIYIGRETKKDWDDDKEHREDLFFMTQEEALFETRGGKSTT